MFSGKGTYSSSGTTDLIDLRDIDANGGAEGGTGSFQWEGTGTFDSAVGEVRIARQGSTNDYLVVVDTDGDIGGEKTLLVHATSAGLNRGDFLL